jgi:hypothetical protein
MAKIIIWDSNTTRATEYQSKFAGIANEILKVTTSKDDLDDCKLFFRHSNDSIDEIENDTRYIDSIKFEFSGGGLTSEIIKEGFPVEAKLESWKDIFRILDILDNEEFTLDHVYYILGLDPKLEKLLEPFATANPLKENELLKEAKEALHIYIKSKS